MLAADALLTNANTIDGSVFVRSFGDSYSNGMNAQVRSMYVGYDPSIATMSVGSVPEPSSVVMAGIAAGAGVAFRPRRRKST